MRNLKIRLKEGIDYSKCVDLIFEYAKYEINVFKKNYYSALHLAVLYNKQEVIFKFLREGEYMGVKDKRDRPAIYNILPKTLETYFDECIKREDIDDFYDEAIVFKFQNLIAPTLDHPNDMTAIEYMSNSKDHQYLLKHPLVESFLFIKWTRLALILYLDLLCYFVFSLIMFSFILAHYLVVSEMFLNIMCVSASLSMVFVLLRRILLFICSSSRHQQSLESCINCLVTILIVVFFVLFVIFHSQTFATICITSVTYEFFMMTRTIYTDMFIVVLRNAIKSLYLYAIFLPIFSLLFYILLKDSTANESDISNF